MFNARMPRLRSIGIAMGAALATATLSTGIAQQAVPGPVTRVAGLAASAVGQAQTPPVLNPSHPETYVVQRGDTLWDIAETFLRDPWYWPEIWQINPQVANPHLIYPGDLLSLAFLDDGRPVVFREGTAGGNTVRLGPQVRVEQLEEPIPTIPFETLRAFLDRPAIIDAYGPETLPYVVSAGEHLMGAEGGQVFIRRSAAPAGTSFAVVHAGEEIIDPDDGAFLGYQGIFVGEGSTRTAGDPATLHLSNSIREVLVGDFLINTQENLPANFLPRAAADGTEGSIISVIDGTSLIGQFQVVMLNRGTRDGLEAGHVLHAYKRGGMIEDSVTKRGLRGEKVQLPDEQAGTIMVFQTLDRMSYALVMEATQELAVLDAVRTP